MSKTGQRVSFKEFSRAVHSSENLFELVEKMTQLEAEKMNQKMEEGMGEVVFEQSKAN